MIFEKAIRSRYEAIMFSRVDEPRDIFYFSHTDFPGLELEPYEFESKDGIILRGGFYSYPDIPSLGLIVFEHGIGGGHRSYMQEINVLAKHGYTVFAYDHTGCMASGGAGALGFAHALSDLDDCLASIFSLEKYKDCEISLVGHSQGGYAVMNIAKRYDRIKSIVSIAGAISAKAIIKNLFRGPLCFYRKAIFSLEESASGAYAFYDARDSLMCSGANVLIIQSQDDPIVLKKDHFDMLKEALGGRDNIKFLLVDGKGHNPNYTKSAVSELARFQKALTEHRKNKHTDDENLTFIDKFDWWKMTEQDMTVFEEIFKVLDK